MSKLYDLIMKSEVVSFDVFDTLLKRNVRNPKDVFDVVEWRYNALGGSVLKGFRNKRVLAEAEARKYAKKEDISIDEIYSRLPYDQSLLDCLKEIELSVESDVLVCNRKMMDAFRFAQQNKKKIIIVSDMYLPKSFLEKILHREGFEEYEKLYVSNEDGFLKSTGNLFKKVFRDFACAPNRILHIGDSKRGDWLAPLKLGMKIYPIRTHYNNLLYHADLKEQNLSRNILYSFLNNSVLGSRYFKIGYETLGPLLYGFSEWLHNEKDKENLSQLLFFSRDGEIMKKAYDILYPEENNRYIYVSRRSLLVPLFWNCSSWTETLNLIPLTRFVNLSSFFEMLGLDSKLYEDKIMDFGFDPYDYLEVCDLSKNDKLANLMSSVWNDVCCNSKKEFDNFKSYIKNLNIQGQYGIVDIGWKGTMQRSYEKLLSLMNAKHSVIGFYLGLTSDLNRAKAYLFSAKQPENELKIWSFLGLFEMMFSASHGSVKKYIDDASCPVEMFEFEFDYNEDTKSSYRLIEEIQKGALSFVEQFNKCSLSSFVEWTPDLAFEGLCNLGINTQKEDLDKISSWKFFNTTLLPLAKPDFSIKLGKMKRDFSNSAWKIAYLKKMLKVPLPYFKIYSFLKKYM